jgi:hypothetical protein
MNAHKALDLVQRYSHHTTSIKALTKAIGDSLELCNGISGIRNQLDEHGCCVKNRETDGKNRDTDLHLTQWYTPDWQGDYDEHPVYEEIGDWSGEECPHCYAAHMAIQSRKEHRKKLGAVKAAMTRGGAQ